jgi:hypothetical protein
VEDYSSGYSDVNLSFPFLRGTIYVDIASERVVVGKVKILISTIVMVLLSGCATQVGVHADNSGERGNISTSIPF